MQLDAERIAETMGGLATRVRMRILARLLDEPATVGDLTLELDISQATVSNHLRVLRHLNLATGERQGRFVIYDLQDDHVRAMVRQILEHSRHA